MQAPTPELLAEFLLWRQALAQQHPAGPQAWVDECAQRWFLALLELDTRDPVERLLSARIAE